MDMTRQLEGTVVAITGASSGIGRETARLLVRHGVRVAVGARRRERLEELAEELGGQAAVLPVELDVTDPQANRRFIETTVAHFGRLDSVVANAGLGHYGGVMDHDDEVVADMIDVNFVGTVWTVRAAVPHFRSAGGGDVVVVASVAGLRGGADEAVYAGSKFAQVGFAGAIDRELRPEGIRVSTICPAGTNTEFAIGAGRTAGDPALEDYLAAQDVAQQIVTVLQQPRRMRTTLWASWSMAQSS